MLEGTDSNHLDFSTHNIDQDSMDNKDSLWSVDG